MPQLDFLSFNYQLILFYIIFNIFYLIIINNICIYIKEIFFIRELLFLSNLVDIIYLGNFKYIIFQLPKDQIFKFLREYVVIYILYSFKK